MTVRVTANINKTTVGGNAYGNDNNAGKSEGQGQSQFKGQGRGQAAYCICNTKTLLTKQ
ncbi:hypothetical protein CHY_0825 [Carboxydothermus hydrogenoformans Z-2901]|uniref:Uncharacterized protein n=1 Tax=Carboxydothermus hydrogenoformans (strain ATCC BAA-161 / DSM 6008 / Z-2901) TaxID=246194 RepID=Q3ADV6_CARHZ|nr:hypothetical protein CHY_0825 [Carboxydothermus hydrogenoformans Z-2901]